MSSDLATGSHFKRLLVCRHIICYFRLIDRALSRLLLIEYVATTASGRDALKAMERKDKRPLPIPVSNSLHATSFEDEIRYC